MTRMSLRKVALGLLATTAAGLPLLAVREAGAADSFISTAPALSGVPQVGKTLTATAGYTAPAGSVVAWSWERCTGAGFATCATINIRRENDPTHEIRAADNGAQLRARLTIVSTAGTETSVSANSPTIVGRNQAQPPAIGTPSPTPTPTPTAGPTQTPTPTPTPGTGTQSSGSPIFEVAPPATPTSPGTQSADRPAVLTPFPVVRVKGRLTSTGARITELAVSAPPSASITALCSGASCPRKTERRKGSRRAVRLRVFERPLRAGTRISIRVTRKGYVGKRTLIRIQKGAAPRRTDLCLSARGRTIVCPAA